jgi:hypothetical protein
MWKASFGWRAVVAFLGVNGGQRGPRTLRGPGPA